MEITTFKQAATILREYGFDNIWPHAREYTQDTITAFYIFGWNGLTVDVAYAICKHTGVRRVDIIEATLLSGKMTRNMNWHTLEAYLIGISWIEFGWQTKFLIKKAS